MRKGTIPWALAAGFAGIFLVATLVFTGLQPDTEVKAHTAKMIPLESLQGVWSLHKVSLKSMPGVTCIVLKDSIGKMGGLSCFKGSR